MILLSRLSFTLLTLLLGDCLCEWISNVRVCMCALTHRVCVQQPRPQTLVQLPGQGCQTISLDLTGAQRVLHGRGGLKEDHLG